MKSEILEALGVTKKACCVPICPQTTFVPPPLDILSLLFDSFMEFHTLPFISLYSASRHVTPQTLTSFRVTWVSPTLVPEGQAQSCGPDVLGSVWFTAQFSIQMHTSDSNLRPSILKRIYCGEWGSCLNATWHLVMILDPTYALRM